MTRARPALLACALALLCAGCQSMQVDELIQTRDPTKAKQGQQVEDALDRAAMEAATASGQPELGRLRLMERAYRRDPENVELATAYAAALRQAGFANRAAIVLGPFAGRPDASPEVRTEFAAVQLELGRMGPLLRPGPTTCWAWRWRRRGATRRPSARSARRWRRGRATRRPC